MAAWSRTVEGQYAPLQPEVYILGRNALFSSVAFWHFAQGHLLEVWRLLVESGLYRRDLRVAFAVRGLYEPWQRYLDLYSAFFDVKPQLIGRCGDRWRHWMPLIWSLPTP